MKVLRALALAIVVACSRDPGPAEVTHAQRAPSAAAASAAPAAGESFRFPAPKRLVAIGDVHGDLDATRAALRLAGAIGDGDRWVGGDLVLVQVGDQLDRGDGERPIVELFDELAAQSSKAGGAVHALNGNHETMNVVGDFRYVTEGGFTSFADTQQFLDPQMASRIPDAMRGRAGAFFPGGPYAQRFAARRVIVVVGDTVFAHGGVTPAHVRYGIERINRETSEWMLAKRPQPPQAVVDGDGPVWTRRYSGESGVADCESLQETLRLLQVRRMVVGHTPQKMGITNACGERVWRIDVGLSRFYGGPVQVLEIVGDRVRPLRAEPAAVAAE
jgi:hypothetical protein